jgi:lipoprotein-anchoring transpeptidase ErfK/SrfK
MRRRIAIVATCLGLVACVRDGSSATSPAPPSAPAPAPATSAAPVAVQASLPSDATTVLRARGKRFHVYERPGPGAVLARTLAATNDWAQPLWLPATESFVDASGTAWYRVRLPVRPNGTTGWVRGSDVRGRDIGERIEVDLSEHRLWRVAHGRVVSAYAVGVGAATTPTAPGRFFVWARVPSDPSGPYGVLALGLSGFSDVITDWVGGGRLAIHGTSQPSDRGEDVSHGCVRVFNPQMVSLADVSLGTPVWIHR